MPYIPKENRDRAKTNPQCAGELNYAITNLVLMYIKEHGLSYQVINDILASFARRLNNEAGYNPYRNPDLSVKALENIATPALNSFELSNKMIDICCLYSTEVTPGGLFPNDYDGTLLMSLEQIHRDCLGALEGAKLEFYRRVAIPYEEIKKDTAGDVYDVVFNGREWYIQEDKET